MAAKKTRRRSRGSSRRSRAGRRYGDSSTVKLWPPAEARKHKATARAILEEAHYEKGHTLNPDPDNCQACAIRLGGEDGPNYAGWARIYVEAQRPIPKKWERAFALERASDNRAYAHALERSIKTFGMPRFVSEHEALARAYSWYRRE